MSKSQSRIPSPARSHGAITPRRHRTRRTLSVASPARSDFSGKLSSVVENFINHDKFTISPMKRKSVLPDDTEIEAPRRASWWKQLEGSARDVFEALDTNKMPDNLLEELEFEVVKDKQNQSVPESSDNESVASIVVPRKRLFNQKKQSQGKFGDIMGSRKSLGRTNIEDESIEVAPKNLFKKGPRDRPVFPAALLDSTNKTINKTVEPETNKQTRPNLFGQAGTKRKNMFTNLVLSESEDDSDVQHKVFGFKRNDNKRMSLGNRNRRMPSLTPSMTTEIDIDDWNLLPSSTMIGNSSGAPDVSKIITDKDMEQAVDENQDNTLTEESASLNPERDTVNKTKSIQNKSLHQTKLGKSMIQYDDGDKTLTNEDMDVDNVSKHKIKQNDLSTDEPARYKRVKENSSKQFNDKEKLIESAVEKQKQISVHIDQRENGSTVEEMMAELHAENIEKETSEQLPSNTTNPSKEIDKLNRSKPVEHMTETNKNKEDVRSKSVIHEYANRSNPTVQDTSKREHEEEREQSLLGQKNLGNFKEVNQGNHDKIINDASDKYQNENSRELSAEEKEIIDNSKEASQENLYEDMDDTSEKDKSEEEMELSAELQDNQDSSDQATQEDQGEDMEDASEKDTTEEENCDSSKDVSQENEDDTLENDNSKKEIEPSTDHECQNELNNEDQDEDMEEMIWNDNDDERENDHVETNKDKQEKVMSQLSSSKNISSKSHQIRELPVEDKMEQENDVIDETPNNSTRDITGRSKKRELAQVNPPEALQNITKDESFRPIGRSTAFRKSKSVVIDNTNITNLQPVRESTIGSEGSRNSSTEGSEWDSHRTTRKTIRQTFGKGFTPRKSLRALVMEQSAKRQTEIYNKTHNTSKTVKNKSVHVKEKNASKMNKTTSKTVLEFLNENSSQINKTKNKSVLDDAIDKNKSKTSKTKNMTDLDVDDLHIRDRRVSSRNLSNNQLSNSKSPVHGTSIHHVSDPLISEPQVSYHKSVHINELETFEQQMSNHDMSLNMSDQADNDSGPEISIHASYGQGMSAEHSDHELAEDGHTASDTKISSKEKSRSSNEISRHNAPVRTKSVHVTADQEMLDYEASDNENSEEELSEPEQLDHEDSNKHSKQEDSVQDITEQEEKEDSEPEQSENDIEDSEHEKTQEESQQEDPQSENEVEPEESFHEQESEHEQIEEISLQEEPESEEEQEEEESGMEEPESENEQSQEIEAESENDQSQEIEAESENEQSQEIEAESENEQSEQMEDESENENEQDHDVSQDNVNDISRESDQESAHDVSEEHEVELSDQDEINRDNSDNLVSGLNSRYQMSTSNRTERVVFDNEMSEQEIDYELSERVSRLTDNAVSEEVSERIATSELTKSRAFEHSRVHDVSVGTKETMRVMQMQKIADEIQEMKQKVREKVRNSIKSALNMNKMAPIQPKYSFRRISKPEPKRPKPKPKPTGVLLDALPKEFMEDLMYKPPKRFQPANAPWITKRLYKFLEAKLEPKYDYRARVRAEELVQTIYSFTKLVRRRDVAPQPAVDELKREMARLHIVSTHFEFDDFIFEYMPREIRVKVIPDIVNKIPLPRNGVFAEILQ